MTFTHTSSPHTSVPGCTLHASHRTSPPAFLVSHLPCVRSSRLVGPDRSTGWHACSASHKSRRRVRSRAAGSGGSSDELPDDLVSQSTQSALHSLSQQSRAGSDYGEVLPLPECLSQATVSLWTMSLGVQCACTPAWNMCLHAHGN